jgi:hypothetical protein
VNHNRIFFIPAYALPNVRKSSQTPDPFRPHPSLLPEINNKDTHPACNRDSTN